MPIGSHKDAFKAHQLVKKAVVKEKPSVLTRMAADILLDFVKSQRQVNAREIPEKLDIDPHTYDEERLMGALQAVDGLCGKCEESHDDACFVNQARRALIAAMKKTDIGSAFDGKTSLDDLLKHADQLAGEAAGMMPESQGGDDAPATAEETEDTGALQAEVEAYKEKDVFRATLIDEIVDTIQKVADGNFAAEMPIHEDEQLGKLATAFNLMLSTINETMKGLDKLVAERSAELMQIMRTVPVGLLTINKEHRINPEYSRAAEGMLRTADLRGRDFLDTIGLTRRHEDRRNQMADYFDVVHMGLMGEEELAEINPVAEFEMPGGPDDAELWLRTRFYPLQKIDGTDEDILVLLENITREKKLARSMAESQNANSRLMAIAEDPDLFRDFLTETRKVIEEVRTALDKIESAEDPREPVNIAFRGVHTIKGGSASFGLDDVSTAAATLENDLSEVRETGALEPELFMSICDQFEGLVASIGAAAEMARKILGDDADATDVLLRVPLAQVKDIDALATQDDPASALAEIHDALTRLQEIEAKRAFAKTIKMIPGLIERLEKEVTFVFEGEETPINVEMAQDINKALVHLIRNAFDHGIEDPMERMETEKSEQGTVTLAVARDNTALTLTIRDDGRGLDADKLRASALKKGLIDQAKADALSTEECHQLILLPGFSTAETVSDISGRGVGMDAVVGAIQEDLGGTVKIASELGKGTDLTISIPC